MRARFASVVTALALASCGGPRPDAMTAAAHGKSMSTAQLGDAICGEGWRWTGTKCAHAEPAVPGDPTTVRAGGDVPPAPSARAAGQLVIDDLTIGTGPEAKPNDQVRVHYTGSLLNGTVFDASKPRGAPFEFRLGQGAVIKGFERGVVGMKVGGIRKLTIAPELGYGRRGAPPSIPPNATLVFEIELLDTKP
jgi:hypothetical protein